MPKNKGEKHLELERVVLSHFQDIHPVDNADTLVLDNHARSTYRRERLRLGFHPLALEGCTSVHCFERHGARNASTVVVDGAVL